MYSAVFAIYSPWAVKNWDAEPPGGGQHFNILTIINMATQNTPHLVLVLG